MAQSKDNLKIYVEKFFEDTNIQLYDDVINGHYYKDLLKASIEVFLERETHYNAYDVYQNFFMIYQITSEDKSHEPENVTIVSEPNTLLNFVKIMEKYEKNTGDLIDKQRDHFIHSVNVFILGLAIYAQNERYRIKFKDYIINTGYGKYYRLKNEKGNYEFSNEEFLYRWGIASLFHDIGYPFEIIGKQLKKFVNDGVKSIDDSYDIATSLGFKDFNDFNTIVKLKYDFADEYRKQKNHEESKFLNFFKPTDILAFKIYNDFKRVENIDLLKFADRLDNYINVMGKRGFIDHGFFSAILVLNFYASLIQKYEKNYDFFFYPIVDSASAILLHNYYGNTLIKELNFNKLSVKYNPLAFLLILCDELQEWNREPFGVKDRKRNHVNDIEMKIDDYLNITYIVKTGSLGVGFSTRKEDLLNSVLNMREIFDGFAVKVDLQMKEDDMIKGIRYSEIKTPDILIRNVENIARLIHQDYKEKNDPDGSDFKDLTPQLKASNFRHARSIPRKLEFVGLEIVLENDSRDEYHFNDDEIEELAIIEHKEWCEEKRGRGWTYGEKRDDEKLIHPDLVEWEELDEETKDKDRDPIRNIPNILASIGMKMVENNIRLLTMKMDELYVSETNSKSFDELSESQKYVNYKQSGFILKILKEQGYDIVSANMPGNDVDRIPDDVVESLSKRTHDAWCVMKTRLGWSYGEDRDKMQNPNLCDWKDLNVRVKDLNRNVFINLPRLCKETGLKLIK